MTAPRQYSLHPTVNECELGQVLVRRLTREDAIEEGLEVLIESVEAWMGGRVMTASVKVRCGSAGARAELGSWTWTRGEQAFWRTGTGRLQ